MRGAFGLMAVCLASALPAQPADLPIAPATTDRYPPGVRVAQTPHGAVYANRKGLTLYGLDMRVLLRAGPDPSKFCKQACAEEWEPLLAPSGATPNIAYPVRPGRDVARPPGFVDPQKAPDWTIIDGASGPQYVYKGWHLVFVRKGDKRGSTAFEGLDHRAWNTLKFVPPPPKIVAPGNVRVAFLDGRYALTDDKGHHLFTGQCAPQCAGWKPFAGGAASAGIGGWRVDTAGDVPQWQYQGAPIFVAGEGSPIPEGGKAVRP